MYHMYTILYTEHELARAITRETFYSNVYGCCTDQDQATAPL